MLFNSAIFVVFSAVFFAAWRLIGPRVAARLRWITLASFVFYGWWDPRFLILILISGWVDYYAALGIRRSPARRGRFLALSLAVNLGLLATFKYLDFFLLMLRSLGFEVAPVGLPLPVGISFYTFQSLSYTIDVYRGELEATEDPWQFFAYLAMFPQLVAGPIVRARELLPQLVEDPPPEPDVASRYEGTRWVVQGFFKKMFLADTIAPAVNAAFALDPGARGGLFWWAAAFLFGAQIYCDFSGYSDIARGLARWMGYDFPVNFRNPYTAWCLRDFWGRWHITLSTWFRDYVYIPLGGSRLGLGRGLANLWVVMLVSGLWHGANWTFLAWGAVHAALLTVERVSGWPDRVGGSAAGRVLGVASTYLAVHLAWVFFRAETVSHAGGVVGRMLSPASFALAELGEINEKAWIAFGLLAIRELWVLNLAGVPGAVGRIAAPLYRRVEWAILVLMALVAVFLRGPGAEFLYFQF